MRRSVVALAAVALLTAACSADEPQAEPSPVSPSVAQLPSPSPTEEAKGIFKLDHLVFIVLENRSFDHYFGTYPGANGIPKKVCVPDPEYNDRCSTPYHSDDLVNNGGPHGIRIR